MTTRRAVVVALAVLPLIACSSSTDGPASAASGTPASGATEQAGSVLVYAPGALAAQTKQLAEAYRAAGLGTMTFEVGHTPVQREQLDKGATPDVWIAANPDDMTATADKGLVDKASITRLGTTSLVVVTAPGNPAQVKAVTDLARPGTKLLLGAETLPIWKVTAKSFAKVEKAQPGFTAKAMGNAVSREMGVQPIVTKVSQGTADAGIVFGTDVGRQAKDKGVEVVEIPAEQNAMLPLVAGRVTSGANADGAKVAMDFLTTGKGHTLLTEAGFKPAAP